MVRDEIFSIADLDAHLKDTLNEMLKEWDIDNIPLTVLSSNYAKTMMTYWGEIGKEKLKSIFDKVEELLNQKDHDIIKDVIATGFLETLMHAVYSKKIEFSSLDLFLGQKSREYCMEYSKL